MTLPLTKSVSNNKSNSTCSIHTESNIEQKEQGYVIFRTPLGITNTSGNSKTLRKSYDSYFLPQQPSHYESPVNRKSYDSYLSPRPFNSESSLKRKLSDPDSPQNNKSPRLSINSESSSNLEEKKENLPPDSSLLSLQQQTENRSENGMGNQYNIFSAIRDVQSGPPSIPPAPPLPLPTAQSIGVVNRIMLTTVPKFLDIFNTMSIGTEIEFKGVGVAVSKNASRIFGYVMEAGDPLFMLTYDMSNGDYPDPLQQNKKPEEPWKFCVIELVSYPCEMTNKQAITSRNEAVSWFRDQLHQHVTQNNHKPLSNRVSGDGRFTMVISNSDHIIAAGDGHAEHFDDPNIGMANMQATIAVSEQVFSTLSSDKTSNEMSVLKSARWYRDTFKDYFLLETQDTPLQNPGIASNIFAYLASVHINTAELVLKHSIRIGNWPPNPIPASAKMLTESDVKNEWDVLPRTRPSVVFNLLNEKDKPVVFNQIKQIMKEPEQMRQILKDGKNHNYDHFLINEICDYFWSGGEVAGHGINNAKLGDAKNPKQAILFEFRTPTKDLSMYFPQEQHAVLDNDPYHSLTHMYRERVKNHITNMLTNTVNRDAFNTWFKDKFKKDTNLAGLSHKVTWFIETYSEKYQQLITK